MATSHRRKSAGQDSRGIRRRVSLKADGSSGGSHPAAQSRSRQQRPWIDRPRACAARRRVWGWQIHQHTPLSSLAVGLALAPLSLGRVLRSSVMLSATAAPRLRVGFVCTCAAWFRPSITTHRHHVRCIAWSIDVRVGSLDSIRVSHISIETPNNASNRRPRDFNCLAKASSFLTAAALAAAAAAKDKHPDRKHQTWRELWQWRPRRWPSGAFHVFMSVYRVWYAHAHDPPCYALYMTHIHQPPND